MKDAVVRDTLGMKKNVLCFEMEAAGLMNHFPCLVIRGICDYADTHKNKEWQGYAAMTAAAYTKDLLCLIHPNRVEALKKMDVLSDISEGLAGIVLRQNGEYRNDVLKWLTPTDYASQQHDHFCSRQPGTGEWFLNSKEYQNWLDTAAEVLLCEGIPGAGKTILTSIVIDQLTTKFHHDRETLNTGIAYIYLSYHQNYEKADNLLLSLLRQLAQIRLSLPNCITALYEQHKDKGTRPSLEAVSSALQSVISTYSRTLIVIDALDECADINGCRSKFLAEILSLRMKSAVNIFATTRHNTEIAKQFEGSTFLKISARGEDVRRYLDDHMKRLPNFVCEDAELKSEVQGTIIDSVQGMFLLAKLYLDSLAHKYTEKAVRDTLSKLSTGSEKYEHAYKDAMERIEIQPLAKKELARRVLSWIIFAKRQLSPTELVHALAVEYGHVELDNRNFINVDDVVLACESLVTVDKETEVIRLVHYTAQDYFEQTRMKWFPTAEVEITRTCATYLSFRNFDSGLCANDTVFEKRLSENPFYSYAAHFWGHHARNVSPLPQEVTAFLVCTKKVQASSQALMAVKPTWRNSDYSQHVPKTITGLHLAAYFGIEKVLENLLGEQGSDPDMSDDFGRTPISYAAGNGYETVAKQLLDTLAINSDSTDNDGQTPLMWAAKEGHSTVVELLLVTGRGDSNARDRYSQTSLLLAAKNGQKAATKLLIENHANLNARDNFGQTPLWWAVRNGDIPIMELLLAKDGVDINTKNRYDQSPLWWAARNGDGAAVNLLLTQDGIDINTKNKSGQTPLGAAAQKGYEAVVSMLLAKKDIEVGIADEYGRTPLLWAARRGHVAVVGLLYNKVGAGINVMDKTGKTPLLSAAENGHTDAVRLLLTAIDVNVNVQDRNDQSALLHSAIRGHDAIAKELLTIEGIEINVEDAYHQTPLLYAVKKEHEGIVKMLLDKEGIDVNAVDRHGQTPLWWAASNGNKILFQLIHTQNGVDINAKNTSGQTPLLWAARNGNEATVKFLLNVPGIDINTKDRENLTPLWWAVKKVYKEVARLLLATNNIEVNSRDKDGQTPLLYATKQGHKKMVELLLNKANIDVNSTDKNGHTSLALALRYSQGDASLVDSEETESGKSRGYNSGHILPPAHDNTSSTKEGDSTLLPWEAKKRYEDIAKLLLAKDGIDVNIRDNYGQSVLLWAAKNGYDTSIDLLVKSDGIDINAKDDLNNSALSLAVAKGHTAVVKLLLSHINLDVVNEDGNGHTPLWLAVETGNETVVELLLEGTTKHRESINYGLLKKAASERKVRIFELLTAQEGVDLNEKDVYGDTLLSWAVGIGHEETVKLLLARTDIDVNAKDTRGGTPLWRAVDGNNISIFKLLLNKENVDINARNYLGVSPLLLAVRNHQPRVLDSRGWRDRSPDGHHENTKGHRSWSPPPSTVSSSLPTVDMDDGDYPLNVKNHIYDTIMPGPLVSYGSRRPSSERDIRYFDTYTNKHGEYPDKTVSPIERDNCKDIIELLLARGDVGINTEDCEGNTPLSAAVWNEDADIVKLLLCKRDINVNKKGSNSYTPIMDAILKNNMTIIRLLLGSTQVNVDSESPTGWTPVRRAIHKANWELLHLLIGHGAQVNSRDRSGKPLLAWVAENDEGKAASILLAVNGIDVNSRDRKNRTPLFYAAENGHESVVEKLLESHDIDINGQDRLEQAPEARVNASAQVDEEYNMGGQTALSVAARREHNGVVKQIIASESVDVNLRDDNGQTALWNAASMNLKSTVGLLLAHEDIDINIKDNSGKTPLLRATELGFNEVVKLLLAADGIDFMAKDDKGRNPLGTAVFTNNEMVVKLILAKGIRDINAKDAKGRTILFLAAEIITAIHH
ncbi:uncharacterized protein TrAtP1_010103 [Trichoderma atroviride]|uniref:uncharacterized protein n=1 Tax=Hypocrea atroviridis TaxID=63577 RepID=UPI003320964C|nr:hypothetical protein TrAtP1_010103 [Trichoderma atroviride]